MNSYVRFLDHLRMEISRRSFLKFGAAAAALMMTPPPGLCQHFPGFPSGGTYGCRAGLHP